MKSTSEFVEVGLERRRPRTGGPRPVPPGSLAGRLLDGATLLATDRKSGYGSTGTILKRHGYRLHQRNDPDGIVMWAERIEP